ncbi:OmpH family outer membrane protein [Bacteroidota bacterium]
MKNLIFIFSLTFVLVSSNIFGQLKIGFVDSDTIMEQLPDALDAQQKLDRLIVDWQDELAKLESEWKEKYDDYENRKLIMSDIKRIEVEKELVQLEDEIANFRQSKFGVSGELFRQQEEIMKPVQNKIFNVIEEIAEDLELDFVFDRSGDILFLYAKDEHDITNLVLEKLK